MSSHTEEPDWGFDNAIRLLHTLRVQVGPPDSSQSATEVDIADNSEGDFGLGDFNQLWDFLGRPRVAEEKENFQHLSEELNSELVAELEADPLLRGVRWRDELDSADLEDNVESTKILTAASLRTRKRATRRAKKKEEAAHTATRHSLVSDTATDAESGDELEKLRRSPDRRSIIADIVGRSRPLERDISPPTSPSPPKSQLKAPTQLWPNSHLFLWQTPSRSTPSKAQIYAKDGLTPERRKGALISLLSSKFQNEKKFLRNAGLLQPAFTPLNVSRAGIHVFVDLSNIMIGFHDCLKLARDIPHETRIRRVPLEFHNLSLVLERGRPAAKRVLVGSDKFSVVDQAKSIGYETLILERVRKMKEATPRVKKFRSVAAGSGFETSGSETNTAPAREKWVEQGVDEILHLKMMESLVDAEKPSTIVLATGDAAEAEYSGGFMKMVERALEKGWMVELVSFRLNTSNAYKRRDFRIKWGQMFKWVQLDEFVEYLIEEDE